MVCKINDRVDDYFCGSDIIDACGCVFVHLAQSQRVDCQLMRETLSVA